MANKVTPVKLYDTKDDRLEIWHLLHRLHPRKRVAFLSWCCQRSTLKGHHPQPSHLDYPKLIEAAGRDDFADEVLTNHVYLDWFRLGSQYGVDLPPCAEHLERVVKAQR